MNFKLDKLYNFVIYPIMSSLNLKKYLFPSYSDDKTTLDRCSASILKDVKYRTEGCKPISKGWIVTNNKSTYSTVFDNYTIGSSILLRFREIVDLLFYGLVMYISGRIVVLTNTSMDKVAENFNKGILDRILIYYPNDKNIFYQIYTKTPHIPLQILITTNKEYSASVTIPKIRIFSDPHNTLGVQKF